MAAAGQRQRAENRVTKAPHEQCYLLHVPRTESRARDAGPKLVPLINAQVATTLGKAPREPTVAPCAQRFLRALGVTTDIDVPVLRSVVMGPLALGATTELNERRLAGASRALVDLTERPAQDNRSDGLQPEVTAGVKDAGAERASL